MKPITREEKQNQLFPEVSKLVKLFNKELNSTEISESYYLIINKQIDIEDCTKIKKIFENAGWKNVRCDQEHNDGSGSYKVVTFLKLEA